jgi:beta-galactosidase
VKLRLNGEDLGNKTPNPWTGAGNNNDLTQATTQLPFQCWWDVPFAAGILRAEGLTAAGAVACSDEKKTAGAPHHIVLTQDAPVVKPNGEKFKFLANGTDAALILATVVDANGVWCPTATDLVTFSVAGPGNYRGGTDQWVTANQPLGYHSPLDPELSAEGGMCKVAVRSTFTPGTVTVTATSGNLGQGSVSFTTYDPATGQTWPVGVMGPSASLSAMPRFKLGADGKVIRYYVDRLSNVSIDVIDAQGRMIRHVVNAVQQQGWHPVPVSFSSGADARGAGIYLMRFSVNGSLQAVKRLVIVR